MIRSLFSGVSGIKAHQTMMDVIGNNIANVNTNGFKASRTLFTDVYYQSLGEASQPTATSGGANPKTIGYGSKVSTIDVLNTRAGYQQTNRPMDMYISGEGYFVIDNGSGTKTYTRVGSLKFDEAGNLVDSNNNFVMGQVPAITGTPAVGDLTKITVPNFNDYTGVAIGPDGKITGVKNNVIQNLGQIALATFPNNDGLKQQGGVYFSETPNSGTPKVTTAGSATGGSLESNGLEMSNVDLSTELTNMMIAQRGLQANSRVVTTSDSILEELVNLKR